MPFRKPAARLDAPRLWEYALKALGTRALSAGELRSRLRRRAASTEDLDAIMAKLKEYGYLNDQLFAETFATARKENQGLGKARVLRDLRQRQVTPAIAEAAAGKAFAGSDEARLIEAYLARKFRNVNLAEYLAEPKHLAAAFRRLRYAGFSTANSIRVLRRFSENAEQLSDSED